MAVEPDPQRAALALRLGADTAAEAAAAVEADVVVEATGSPAGLELALRAARREVHVKSTTGRPTLGFRHPTEMVVDEVSLAPFFRRGAGAPGAERASPRRRADHVSTSRCGDLETAFPRLRELERRGIRLGDLLVTHRVPAGDLNSAFQTARLPGAVKVVVEH